MAGVVADHGVHVVIMHNRESVDDTIDIVADIRRFFARSLEIADKAGIAQDKIILDPGIGFGKSWAQSITVLRCLNALTSFGRPLLVGASRKGFIGGISPSEPMQRLGGSLAAHLTAARRGAQTLRVHDVAQTVQALRVAAALEGLR